MELNVEVLVGVSLEGRGSGVLLGICVCLERKREGKVGDEDV